MKHITKPNLLGTISIILLLITALCMATHFSLSQAVWGQSAGSAADGVSTAAGVVPSGAGTTGIRLSELVTTSDGTITQEMKAVTVSEVKRDGSASLLPAVSAPALPQSSNRALPELASPFPTVSKLPESSQGVKTPQPSKNLSPLPLESVKKSSPQPRSTLSLSSPSDPSFSKSSGQPKPATNNFPGLVPSEPENANPSLIPGKSNGMKGDPAGMQQSKLPGRIDGVSGQGRPGPSQFEGPQEACVVLQKIAPEEVQVNREEVFKIVVKNTGKGIAKNVVLRDQVPAKTILVSTSPKSSSGRSGELVWNNFDLAPGESREFQYIVVPQEEGELGSVASVGFSAEASVRTRCTKPVLELDVKSPSEVVVGGEVTLDISITNTGTGTATGVVLLETIPEGLHHPGGKVLDNQIKTIAPEETKRLALTLKGVKPGKTVNRLSVTADNGIVEERESTILITSPELQLEIAGAKTRYLDREATYILKIRNPGTAPAKEVKLVAELPKNFEFVRTNNLGEYKKEKHAVLWELVELPQNLPPGELELVVRPTQVGAGKIVLRGTGQSELAAEVSQEIEVDGLPALAYEVRSLADPVEVGKEAIYEVRIVNRGTKNSTNINMSILIPEQMKIVASDGPTPCRDDSRGATFGRIDSLAPKQEVVYRIRAVCSKPGDHRIKVQVSSDDMELLVKEESTRVYY